MNDSFPPPANTGLDLERNDTMHESGAFASSPFAEHPAAERPLQSRATEPRTLDHKRLARVRKNPVAQLFKGSIWALKTWQLDLDCPPSILAYLDQRLAESIAVLSARPQDLDTLYMDFSSEQNPGIDNAGHEHFTLRLTLRQLGRMLLDPPALLALKRCVEPDRALQPDSPALTINAVFELIMQAHWTNEYHNLLDTFWSRHAPTWEMLARLSFLDGLHRLRERKRITPDGYVLALNALGLTRMPQSFQDLGAAAEPQRSTVHCITLNGEIIPGLFHLKSHATEHCYIHLLGELSRCDEYISAQAPWDPQRVLATLNASPWHRLHLPPAQAGDALALSAPIDHPFTTLATAHRQFSLDRLHTYFDVELETSAAFESDDALLMPILPALSLVSTLDHWHGQTDLQQRIPTPLKTARRLMQAWLKEQQQAADPEQVFVRYLRGSSTAPLGHARAPANNISVPHEQPTSLTQALMENYREQRPTGYIDHGGRSVLYSDPSGKGIWSADSELPISASSLEQHIMNIDFLDVMARRLKRFWEKQGPAIEQSLASTLVAQALLSLKSGSLSRSGLNLLVTAMEDVHAQDHERQTRCVALGFYLKQGVLPSIECHACPGLLVFSHPRQPGRVLYQPGQRQAFFEFSEQQQLSTHLLTCAADEHWRTTLLHYLPIHLHERLTYILELWGGVRPPPAPTSNLRPWVDVLYNEDVHKSRSGTWCEHDLQVSPFTFVHQCLRQNSQDNARNSIVTSREVALRYWIDQINSLHILLAPLALLVAPAALAALTASAASLALHVQAARLPGQREAERRQIMCAILSLGLLQLAPSTPGLLRAFLRFSSASKALTRAPELFIPRAFSLWLRHASQARHTRLEPFFNTSTLMKTWTIPGNAMFSTLPVRAWKLGRKFLLWTSDRSQARTLVVSSHGYYLPWTRTTAIPNGTQLQTYAPHGHELIDPSLHRVVSQRVQPYSRLDNAQHSPVAPHAQLPPLHIGDRLLAGTPLPGRIKNYSLAKFQSERYESYRDISNIVRNSHQSAFGGQLPATPMDVLTVRNRFGMTQPTLQDLFTELSRQGIHYDQILLVHCRCSAVSSLLGRSPTFSAPTGSAPISP